MKRYLAFLFISILSMSLAFAQISGPGAGGGGSLISGVSPISGCSPGLFLYNNSGVLGCQSGSGGISGPGSVTANDIVTWTNTTTIADSGISLGSQAKGLFLATPSGGSGLPALRAITAADLASITTASGLTTVAGGTFASGAFAAAYSLPAATTSTIGGVKTDAAGTIANTAGAISVNYGTVANTAAQGNDSRITGALSASATTLPATFVSSSLTSAAGGSFGSLAYLSTINNTNWSGTALSVANGGTGVSSPGLIAGTNITSITGTWPNQTINASGSAVSSVSNSDSTLTVTPTTGAVVASLNLGHANTWTSTQTFPSPAFTGTVTGAGTIPVGVISATGTPSSTTFLRGDGTWNAVSGGITGPGTTVVGNIATWNSTTGAAIADSGISASSNTITGASSSALGLIAGVGQQLSIGGNGIAFYKFSNSNNFVPLTTNTGNLGLASAGSWWASASLQTLDLEGSSTGYDNIQSGNTGTGIWTYKTPAATGTGSDTLVSLAATNAHTGPNSFAGAATASAANTTTIMGGTTAPTFSNAGYLSLGGLYTLGSVATAGSGGISLSSTYGLQFQGSGSTGDTALANSSGTNAAYVKHATQNVYFQGGIVMGGAHPTLTTGTCSGSTAVGGLLAGGFTAPTCAAGTIILTALPAAPTGYTCTAQDETTPANTLQQTAHTTTSATFKATTTASDIVVYSCVGW